MKWTTRAKVREREREDAVLRAVGSSTGGLMYGLDIMYATGLSSGQMYPLLIRLERQGRLVRLEPKPGHWPERVGYRLPADRKPTQ